MNHARWTVPLSQSPPSVCFSLWMSVCLCVWAQLSTNVTPKASTMLDGFSAENYRNTLAICMCTRQCARFVLQTLSTICHPSFSVALMEFLCFVMAKIHVYWMSEPMQLLLYTRTHSAHRQYHMPWHHIYSQIVSRFIFILLLLSWVLCDESRAPKKYGKQTNMLWRVKSEEVNFWIWFLKAVEMFKFDLVILNRLHVSVVLFLFMIVISFTFSISNAIGFGIPIC